jgi:hypothetical protein
MLRGIAVLGLLPSISANRRAFAIIIVEIFVLHQSYLGVSVFWETASLSGLQLSTWTLVVVLRRSTHFTWYGLFETPWLSTKKIEEPRRNPPFFVKIHGFYGFWVGTHGVSKSPYHVKCVKRRRTTTKVFTCWATSQKKLAGFQKTDIPSRIIFTISNKIILLICAFPFNRIS